MYLTAADPKHYYRNQHGDDPQRVFRQLRYGGRSSKAESNKNRGSAHDALGYFNPGSVVQPLEEVMARPVEIATFNNHLAEFSEEKRGTVLERDGQPRAYRYRFHDPLMVPYVFMDALATGLIGDEHLAALLGGNF